MKRFFVITMCLLGSISLAQVGIGTTNPNSALDITVNTPGTPSNTDGILIPRIHNFPATDPTAAQDGMLVFVTGAGAPTEGFYYWDNGTTSWILVNGSNVQEIDDLIDGKSDSDGSNNGSSIFLGEAAGAVDDSSDNRNVGVGYNSMDSNTTGSSNVAIGWNSLNTNTSGNLNTAIGSRALIDNLDGGSNTSVGEVSMPSNTSGDSNTSIGQATMLSNTTGSYNTVLGGEGLRNNSTGNFNVSVGYRAGDDSNTDGNVYLGSFSGFSNSSSNRLFIENTTADQDNALIYGEFGTDNTTTGNLLRTNSEFQIGNPTGTGYSFPTTDGSAGQVLTTDGSGQVTFTTPISNSEWNDGGSYIAPVDGDAEMVLIGSTTVDIGKLQVTSGANNAAIQANFDGTSDYGIFTELTSGSGLKYGLYNDIGGDNGNFSSWGSYNNMTTAGNGSRIAIYNTVNSTGSGNKYATWNYIPVGDPGTHYGIYSDAQNASGYAGYFVGRMSLGNATSNRYLMPGADGTAGQIITTDGSGNLSFSDAPDTYWSLTGNSGTNSTTNFIGTTDNQALSFRVNNSNKLRISNKGQLEIFNTASSVYVGELAGANYSITTAFNNVGVGYSALEGNSSGVNNTAIGSRAMESNTTGYQNVAAGYFAMNANTSGRDNVAVGNFALTSNTIGVTNTALGPSAMSANTSGSGNVGIGFDTLDSNTQGVGNVGVGHQAGQSNTTGDYNVFLGYNAGFNETGDHTLYIENTNADADNALIYGEFDNNILRTNGELQISNPTSTGYAFPTADGSADQLLATDGSGQLSFVDAPDDIGSFALAKMTLSGTQNLPASTVTKLNFDTTSFDLGSNFNTTSDRFDVTEAGHYRIDASFGHTGSSTSTGLFSIIIRVNGTNVKAPRENHHGNGGIYRDASAVVQLSVGDYIEIFAFGNAAITINDNVQYTSFEVERIR